MLESNKETKEQKSQTKTHTEKNSENTNTKG